ncbi:PucR family transcriptional regulator [Microbacteriaceae bacterium 4G12]
MELLAPITVENILKRKHFLHVKPVAGEEGLSRIVKWVHVVEVPHIRNLLKGQELILSTGIGWKADEELFYTFVEQLIECQVAALCIDFGKQPVYIPDDVLSLANRHQFPILLFSEEVPFVEITQDLHSYLIHQHYEMISKLEQYSQQLNKKLLDVNDERDILSILYTYLDGQLLYMTKDKQVFMPNIEEKGKQTLLEMILNEDKAIRQTVEVWDRHCGELFLLPKGQDLHEFAYLLLDRTAIALAQYHLREMYVEEKRKAEETQWLHDWLNGEHAEAEVREHLELYDKSASIHGLVVVICKLSRRSDIENMTYIQMYFRTILEQQGFYVLATEKQDQLVFILLNKREVSSWKTRLEGGFNRLAESEWVNKYPSLSLSIGKFVRPLNNLHKSYKAALETLKLKPYVKGKTCYTFYDDLHAYRFISLFQKQEDFVETVMEYLQPLLAYDRKYNGSLLQTLKVYLACNGSKNETAKKLFIVRQTLYHRIEKLEGLLGKDFMNYEKRLAIEFALLAFDYMSSQDEMAYS